MVIAFENSTARGLDCFIPEQGFSNRINKRNLDGKKNRAFDQPAQ